VLALAAGDAVGADARLLSAAGVEALEATLTGESEPVSKDPGPLEARVALPDRSNMLYAGTHLAAGRARAVVVATGSSTEVGRIATLAEGADDGQTPLERRMAQLGKWLALASVGVFAVVLGVGLARGLPFDRILMVAISQLVSAVPEGLPVAMTVGLAVGMQRMAQRRAIVRRLAAVESLGCTTVICTDKTGTLTRNEMTVTAVVLPGGRELRVSGTGYAPAGELRDGAVAVRAPDDRGLRALVEAGVLCNDATVRPVAGGSGRWEAIGDPTEAALLALARKAGTDPEAIRLRHPRRAEIPFSSTTKTMTTLHGGPGGPRLVVKGAPERVLDLCGAERVGDEVRPLAEAGRREALAAADRLGHESLRVLGVAEILDPPEGLGDDDRALRGRATWLGLVGQMDPPRDEAREAVRSCRAAGIRTVMITGDQKATGMAVARMLDIARDGDVAMAGPELEAMAGPALAEVLPRVSVFARVLPEHKLRIVEALQASGEVVAVTGDGVNDAPALARSDVGVAMGRSGTDVAREAAEIVVTDDDFATIVAAVDEGRVVYRNIQKALLLLLSTGLAEVAVLVLALLAGLPLPFASVQILWNNVVTEGTITVNLVMEPGEGDELRRPPIPRAERLLTAPLLRRLVLMSAAILAVTLGFFALSLARGVPFAKAQTATFTLLAVCEWFNVLNCRSETRSALRLGMMRNRWLAAGLLLSVALQAAVIWFRPLGRFFHTVPLSLPEVAGILGVGSVVLWVEEVRKALARRRAAR
jgi:magnesium-transporting ATPase (P-type)